MKVAIIGSRNFSDYNALEDAVSRLCGQALECIISGGAKGADSLAEQYAQKFAIPIKVFKPDWKQYGRGAGVVRNRDIVSHADVVIAFWDGVSRGTASSIKLAQKMNKTVHVVDTNISQSKLDG